MWTSPNCHFDSRRAALAIVSTLIVSVCPPARQASAADVVVISAGRDGTERKRLIGEVIEYTGRELRIVNNGREQMVPGGKVISIQTARTDEQKRADNAFADGDYRSALDLYLAANRAEQRAWVQRRFIARVCQCYRNLGAADKAGDAFKLLYQSDSATPYIEAIPLAWRNPLPSPAMERKAATWLAASDNDAANLIGASWLLRAQRESARDKLNELTNSTDARIAKLAAAQLWRDKLVTVREADIERWRTAIGRLPDSLRGGPYYLLGQAWSRLDQPENAALAFLRPPILFPDDAALAAESLLAAGRELEKMKRPEDARQAYREVISKYSGAQIAQEARERLERLQPQP
ncbi:MAG: hypothetical protein QGG36_04875 [Pirellulaceae bacterium]|jgi:tetratricopeptide (TPR) repeat protein|nr:hypothetical protein [Pirellulaceae bacterium]